MSLAEPLTYSVTDRAPYWDADLSENERVADLIGRMTLQEKARQLDLYMGEHFVDRMRNHTMMARDAEFDAEAVQALLGDAGVGAIHDLYPPTSEIPNAIQRWLRENSRLGIPALFAEEALHGVCSPGHTAFPQSIGLASTWNPALIEQVGRVIGAELRSSNVHFAFSPVLDVARDPRWGRTEETYGEDTHLVTRIGLAYVIGMQGESLFTDHTAAAEPKHFAGHGAPEGGRNTAPLHSGPREMAEVMLPPFEAAVREGRVLGIMSAYHEIDGIPCSANRDLLTGILREQWGFEGIVLSDLGAIRRLVEKHRVAESPADAVRQALTAGMDMQYYDFDHATYEEAIVSSVRSGLLPTEIVDRAVSRVLLLKFRLGLFDNPFISPLLAARVKRCPAHLTVSRQAARESLCLLKNAGNLLPLPKNQRRIAVVGPNAAHARSGDYSSGSDDEFLSPIEAIRAIVSPCTEVKFVDGTSNGGGSLKPMPANWLKSTEEGLPGLKAELYANPTYAEPPLLVRTDATIDFNWVAALPAAGMPADDFSVRWTGFITPDRTVSGSISIPSQDNMRVWLDGECLLNSWNPNDGRTTHMTFEEGRSYRLRVEYRKVSGGSNVQLGWSEDSSTLDQAVEIARDSDVVIAIVGEVPGLSGEGMDRASLDLPNDQMELLRAVHATGTPVVAVLINGRPLTISWAADNLPAIVEAWYPSEFGGEALAAMLFGDLNPAGRLPITFPRSLGQLPLTYDRKPSSDSPYVDSDSRPLFAFGHGLSYTRFEYSNLSATVLEASRLAVIVMVDVENAGDRDGDEVVQLYVRDVVGSVTSPMRSLKAFEKIHLKAGERKTVSFTLGHRELSLVDRQMRRIVEPGAFELFVGGSSEAKLKAEFTIFA